jgi:predicted phosphodiesterase
LSVVVVAAADAVDGAFCETLEGVTTWAILSDIHGNRAALDAVLADAEEQLCDRIAVLGDVVDYGPDPVACLERVASVADVWLIGNHEEEIVKPSGDLEDDVVPSLDWAREQLLPTDVWKQTLRRIHREGFVGAATCVTDSIHFAHASPASPTQQYVWPSHEAQYVCFNGEIDKHLVKLLAEAKRDHAFVGHTHVPAVLVGWNDHGLFSPYAGPCERDALHTFVGPRAVFFVPTGDRCVVEGVAGRRFLANPGSVGQPRRLGDPRASYLLYDGNRIEIRRVAYDVEDTCARLARMAITDGLRENLRRRLRTGR